MKRLLSRTCAAAVSLLLLAACGGQTKEKSDLDQIVVSDEAKEQTTWEGQITNFKPHSSAPSEYVFHKPGIIKPYALDLENISDELATIIERPNEPFHVLLTFSGEVGTSDTRHQNGTLKAVKVVKLTTWRGLVKDLRTTDSPGEYVFHKQGVQLPYSINAADISDELALIMGEETDAGIPVSLTFSGEVVVDSNLANRSGVLNAFRALKQSEKISDQMLPNGPLNEF